MLVAAARQWLFRQSFRVVGQVTSQGVRVHSFNACRSFSSDSADVDCVVIGAGVVGLACARALAMKGLEVLILEAGAAFGMETSSRHSEVIHAGINYPVGSLKASLCVEGKQRLYEYCVQRNIAHKRCGKLLVANGARQLEQLKATQERAVACGVHDLVRLSRAEAVALEPAVNCDAALLSPSTGIFDSHRYMECLLADAEAHGATLVTHSRVVGGEAAALNRSSLHNHSHNSASSGGPVQPELTPTPESASHPLSSAALLRLNVAAPVHTLHVLDSSGSGSGSGGIHADASAAATAAPPSPTDRHAVAKAVAGGNLSTTAPPHIPTSTATTSAVQHTPLVGFRPPASASVAPSTCRGTPLHDTGTITTLRSKVVINAAGLHAQSISRTIQGLQATSIPPLYLAKGNYFALSGEKAPFTRLIYPMPEAGGLGVHLTLDLGGQARFGPDVEWVDMVDYTVHSSRAEVFYPAVRSYWPGLPDNALQPSYSGIRPKLSGRGQPGQDFVLQGPKQHGVEHWVNLYGIESPGLTSSLAIAEQVAMLALH